MKERQCVFANAVVSYVSCDLGSQVLLGWARSGETKCSCQILHIPNIKVLEEKPIERSMYKVHLFPCQNLNLKCATPRCSNCIPCRFFFIAPPRLKSLNYSEQCCIYVRSSGATTSKGEADQRQEKAAAGDTLGVIQAEVTMVDLAGVHTNDHPGSHTVPGQ